MKALVLQELKRPLVIENRPSPRPGPGEVVVDLRAAALNRRDFFITRGLYPGIQLPVVLGSDGAGVVAEVGNAVDAGWLGAEVIINPGIDWGGDAATQGKEFTILGMPRDGTFAEQVAVPAGQLHRKPGHLDWPAAAALPLGGVTAYRAVFAQGGLRSGETVWITGIGGGVATWALQFSVAAGAEVWVTSSSPGKILRARELGAQDGLDYRTAGWAENLAERGGAPHLIIDGAGGSGHAELVNAAAPGGRIVNYGATAGPPGQLDLFKVFWKQLRLQGSTMGSPEDFAGMLELVEKHEIQPVIDAVYPLADGDTAIERMGSSPQFGKMVLAVG